MTNFNGTLEMARQSLLAGNSPQTEQICRQILQTDPTLVDALVLLGESCNAAAKFGEATTAYQQVTKLRPQDGHAHNELGIALAMGGRIKEAVASFRQALHLQPDYAFALNNLGNALRQLGETEEAVTSCRMALRLRPDYPEAYNNLGNALSDQGKLHEAEESFRRALQLRPSYANALSNLGLLLATRRQFAEAISCQQEAIRLRPNFAQGYNNLGRSYVEVRELDQAVSCFQRALQIDSQLSYVQTNLGGTYFLQGQVNEAITTWREVLKTRSDDLATHSNLLFCLNYCPDLRPAAFLAEHRLWATTHCQVPEPKPFSEHDFDRRRRLRIGYVSPDFRQHAVAMFLKPILANHDPRQVEVFAYSQVPRPDSVTSLFQSLAQGWRSICGVGDDQVAEQIRRDGIDILVDLAGHTQNNRLRLFAFKPAPIQVTYLGYPNTTGLATMDYRLTDEVADPCGEEPYHTETLLRLPTGFCCFSPPAEAPEVKPPPEKSRPYFTFGSVHPLAKLNRFILDTWAKILAAVPHSRLLLFRDTLRGQTRERIREHFTKSGISAERILMDPPAGCEANHLLLFNEIDLLLDAFPFSGHTTVCESLWMGVPVVTLRGNRFAGRMAASVLTRLDLNDLIAETPEHYSALAVRWSERSKELTELRAGLRQRMRTSSLCDGRQFTHYLERAYRSMWEMRCSSSER